jgi:hypothetical protein
LEKQKVVYYPLSFVLAVYAVITLAFPTEENGHRQAVERGLGGNATAEDDHGWYAPVAMILTPISKDKVEVKRNTFRPMISGSSPYWRNRNPWHHPALPSWWYPYGNFFFFFFV